NRAENEREKRKSTCEPSFLPDRAKERCLGLTDWAKTWRKTARAPIGCLCPKHRNRFLGRQVFWLTALDGPRTTSPRQWQQSWLQWYRIVRRPGRSQRRPRSGFAPLSLLSPSLGAENLSRLMNDVYERDRTSTEI